MVRIYTGASEVDTSIIASLLEAEGILLHVSRGPLHAAGMAALASEKAIFVSESDVERAKKIIDEYLKKVLDNTPPKK